MNDTRYDGSMARKRALLTRILRDELTERQRTVILAYYRDCKSTREIAEALRVTPSAVLRVRHRAEKRIAHYLRYCL